MSTVQATSTGNVRPLKIRGWYKWARRIVGFLFRLLSHLEVEGREHIPDVGPFLLVTNHLHWLDAPLIAIVVPYRLYVFAGEKWEKHWLLGPFFRSLDAIFVRRGEVDRRALRQALAVLHGGGALGMAPEGTRSKTGGLQRARAGAAYLAFHGQAPILPVVTTGQQNLFPALRRGRRARIRVRFAPLVAPPHLEGRPTAEDLQALTDEIMYRLAAMLPPEYRGVYADVEDRRPDLVALYQKSPISTES